MWRIIYNKHDAGWIEPQYPFSIEHSNFGKPLRLNVALTKRVRDFTICSSLKSSHIHFERAKFHSQLLKVQQLKVQLENRAHPMSTA